MNVQQPTANEEQTAGNHDRGHRCQTCARAFKRPEHLKRHEASHDQRMKFVCKVCAKAFSRSDTLSRHRVVHEQQSSIRGNHGHPSTFGRRRACRECAKARERCSRGEPCQRCSVKVLRCSYPISTSGQANRQSPQGNQESQADDVQPFEMQTSPTANYRLDLADNYTLPTNYSADLSNANSDQIGNEVLQAQPTDMLFNETQQYPADQYNPLLDLDFPMNWLPIDLGSNYDSLAVPSAGQSFNGANEVGHASIPSDLNQSSAGPSPLVTVSYSVASDQTPRTYNANMNGIATSPGTLYANSTDGARLSSSKRAKMRQQRPRIPGTTDLLMNPGVLSNVAQVENSEFPDTQHITVGEDILQEIPESHLVSPIMQEQLREMFHQTCVIPNHALFRPYSSQQFPSQAQMSLFVHLYFEHFLSHLPVIHTTCQLDQQHIFLVLAMAAVGSQYANTLEFVQCSAPLHEFLRRLLAVDVELSKGAPLADQALTSLFLNQLGMIFGHSKHLKDMAELRHGHLLQQCRERSLLQQGVYGGDDKVQVDLSLHDQWRTWIRLEGRRRLGYAILLLDVMLAIFHKRPQSLDFSDIKAQLPNDDLWVPNTAESWQHAMQRSTDTPTLPEAVNALFRTKKVALQNSQFAQVLLIHGVYNEIWQIQKFTSRPLSSFLPSAEPDGSSDKLRPADWILSNSTFASWRNAACDCIDALHWVANAQIARLSGVEPQTVFHLHFARTVLLTPYDAIRTIVSHKLAHNRRQSIRPRYPTDDELNRAELEVLNWVQRDEHKARLAMIHTGCLLWHVRRFSSQAFYEPPSIYLTVLAIWAYSTYIHQVTYRSLASDAEELQDRVQDGTIAFRSSLGNGDANTTPMSLGDIDIDDQPALIRLDRPNDDEMVQLFVRKGRPHIMRAHITGVGDICAKSGPLRIIREGLKILRSVDGAAACWGRAMWDYCVSLKDLLHVLSQTPEG